MFDKNTVGNDEISAKIGEFLTEHPSYRRRFLRRINNFNRVVNDIVGSMDLSVNTKVVLFNKIYQDARQSANFVHFKSGTNNSIHESYPAYLLITYFKTVWDGCMPYLLMQKEHRKIMNDTPINDPDRKCLIFAEKNNIMNDINIFIERKVEAICRL